MKRSPPRHRIYYLLLLSAPPVLLSRGAAAQATAEHQQLFSLDAFAEQQTCVQYCFTTKLSGCTTDVLGSAIGCPIYSCSTTFAAVDNCYCRSDLQSEAQSFLTSCIRQSCTVGDVSVDLANAGSIYASYCTSKGYTALPATVSASTTASNGNLIGSTTTAPTGGSISTTSNGGSRTTATSPTNPTDTSTKPSSSSTTSIVAGVMGGIAALAILVAIVYITKHRRSKRLAHPMPMPNLPYRPEYPVLTQLRPPVATPPEDDISPYDSASNINVPPTYPRYLVEPSLVSTQR